MSTRYLPSSLVVALADRAGQPDRAAIEIRQPGNREGLIRSNSAASVRDPSAVRNTTTPCWTLAGALIDHGECLCGARAGCIGHDRRRRTAPLRIGCFAPEHWSASDNGCCGSVEESTSA